MCLYVNKGLDTFLFLVCFNVFLDRMENSFLNTLNYKRNREIDILYMNELR